MPTQTIQELLEDRFAKKVILFEMLPYKVDAGQTVGLYFSSTGEFVTGAADTPATTPYDGRVKGFILQRDMFSGQGALRGAKATMSGTVRLANANHDLDYLLERSAGGLRQWNFKRRKCRLLIGGDPALGWTLSDFHVLATTTIDDLTFDSQDVIVTLGDQLDRLKDPIQSNRYGGNREQATSASSISVGLGTKTFTLVEAGKTPEVGDEVWVCRTTALATTQMRGDVTAWNSGTKALEINISEIVGSGGPYTNWTIYIRPFEGGVDVQGQTKPLVFGTAQFAQPAYLGIVAGLYCYQINDGPCTVTNTYDGALGLTEVGFPAGASEWAQISDRGLLFLGSRPSSIVSCTVEYGGGSTSVKTTYTSEGEHSFVVPTGVTSLSIVKAWGAGGAHHGYGGSFASDGYGGGGGYAEVTALGVTPGETLTIVVGEGGISGGAGGNAFGGASSIGAGGLGATATGSFVAHGGSGGGASGIKRGSTRLIVAGGGGGGGMSLFNNRGITGGAGGGTTGQSPSDTINGGGLTFVRPTGGTAVGGGVRGTVSGGSPKTDGITATGQDGAAGVRSLYNSNSYLPSSGGGGGYFGGASGAVATPLSTYSADAAAGGSSYAPGGTATSGSGRTPGSSTDPDLATYQAVYWRAPTGYGSDPGVHTAGGAGQVTISYTIVTPSTATPTIATMIEEIARRAGFGDDEIDAATFAQVDSVMSEPVGKYMPAGSEQTFASVIEEFGASGTVWYDTTGEGAIRIGYVDHPAISVSPAPALALTQDDILSSARLPSARPLWQRRIGAEKCWRVHTQAEIRTGALDSDEEFVQSEYRQGDPAIDVSVRVRDASAADEGSSALFIFRSSATIQALHELSLFTPEQDTFQINAKTKAFLLGIGDELTITEPRLGLDDTPVLVTGISLDGFVWRTGLIVWR